MFIATDSSSNKPLLLLLLTGAIAPIITVFLCARKNKKGRPQQSMQMATHLGSNSTPQRISVIEIAGSSHDVPSRRLNIELSELERHKAVKKSKKPKTKHPANSHIANGGGRVDSSSSKKRIEAVCGTRVTTSYEKDSSHSNRQKRVRLIHKTFVRESNVKPKAKYDEL